MLYTKVQPQSFRGSGEEVFKSWQAILLYGPWPFVQIFNPPLTEGSTWSLKKLAQVYQRRSRSRGEVIQRCGGMCGWTDRWTDDKRGVVTIAHPLGSGELKIMFSLCTYPKYSARANSDPDQMTEIMVSNQDLHCLPLILWFLDTLRGSQIDIFFSKF